VADDLVDNAKSEGEIAVWLAKLTRFLDISYANKEAGSIPPGQLLVLKDQLIKDGFPPPARSALSLLPTAILPPEPLYQLLDGFRIDASFDAGRRQGAGFPIRDEASLERYATCVAGTVGELCLALISHHAGTDASAKHMSELRGAARRMGIALQCVNISRDIAVDAKIGRVYLPTTWLKEEGLTPEMVLRRPEGEAVERLRRRLLHKAFELYRGARPTMRRLPDGARAAVVVAVENYMEIGRVLLEAKEFKVKHGRATVPAFRRLKAALIAYLNA
jgi:15-cis-phytoene synthase/lycopene beta-cyclase